MLKDVLSQANLHLECYRSHEKILSSQYKKLKKKEKTLKSELSYLSHEKSSKKNFTKEELLVLQSIEEKVYLEDQIVKYKFALENLKTEEEQVLEELNQSCFLSKLKDNEIKNITSEIQKTKINQFHKKKTLGKCSSDKRCGINKEDIRPFTIGSYSLGFGNHSQKSTTLESSRSSHLHL